MPVLILGFKPPMILLTVSTVIGSNFKVTLLWHILIKIIVMFVFNTPTLPMLMTKSLKALEICLGSKIVLPFANLNSCGRSRFLFLRFKVSFIVCQIFFVLAEYLLNALRY